MLGFGASNTTIVPQEALLATSKVTLDAVVTEGTEYTVTVTDHPVEDGTSVSDHIRDEPDKITIDGIITRTPVENPISLLLESSQRHEDAWRQLYSWLKGHTLVKVITTPRTWENMAIAGLSRSRSAEVGEAVRVTITFKEIVKVFATAVEAPKRPAGVQNPAAANGVATTAPAPRDMSILNVLTGG